MPDEPQKKLFEPLIQLGLPVAIPLLIFAGCLIIALVIHVRGLDLRHRLGFLAFSLIPFLAGVAGLCHSLAREMVESARWANIYDLRGASLEFPPYLTILTMASIESGILLFIAGLLLIGKSPPASPRSGEGGGTPNR